VGVSPTTVHRVISTYNRLGVAAVETPGTGGRRHQYLTLEHERAFLQPFLARAARGELATATEIQQAFEAETKQPVANSTIYRLLARHGVRQRGAPSRSARTSEHPPAHEQTVLVRKRGEWRTTSANRPPSLQSYPSDLTDQEWAILSPLLPLAKPGGRPRTSDLRAVQSAILYLDRTGGQWRALPHDFPPWSTVWSYFRTWRNDGTWERIHTALREQTRLKQGRQSTPSAAIIDSQSVKTSQKGGSAATTAAKK
jgi:putative transposase